MNIVEKIKDLQEQYNTVDNELKYATTIYTSLRDKYLGHKKMMGLRNVEGTFDIRTGDAIREILEYQKCLSGVQYEIGTEIFSYLEKGLEETKQVMDWIAKDFQ